MLRKKAAARVVAARFGGEAAAAREAATHATVAREATWSLMRLLLVQLLKLPLLLFVQLSLLVQLASKGKKGLLVQWMLLIVQGKWLLLVKLLIVRLLFVKLILERLLLVQLLYMPLLMFVQLSLLVQLALKGKRSAAREAASRSAYLVVRATAYREAVHAAYRAATAPESDTQAATPRAATCSLV